MLHDLTAAFLNLKIIWIIPSYSATIHNIFQYSVKLCDNASPRSFSIHMITWEVWDWHSIDTLPLVPYVHLAVAQRIQLATA